MLTTQQINLSNVMRRVLHYTIVHMPTCVGGKQLEEYHSGSVGNLEQLHIEDEDGAGRDDGPDALLTVGQVGGDD